jgi:signal transduction histidine kinase/ActR/RegA family two-component response regulator
VSLRSRTERLEELVEIGIALAGERDMATLPESIVQHARRFTRANGGMMFLREEDQLRPAVGHPALESPDVIAQVASTGRLVNSGSTLVVPLLERTGDVIGVLVLTNATDANDRVIPFDTDDEGLVCSLAAHAAAALHNARVYGAAVRHADKLTALSRLTGLMTSAHEPQEIFRAIAEAATTLLGAVWARVWVNDPGERVVRAQATFGVDRAIDDLIDLPVIPYGQGLVGRIAEHRVPEYVRDIVHDPRWLRQRLGSAARVHGFAGLPLVTGSGVGGVLAILFPDRRDFGPEDRQLMELLAGHAAVALENADLARRTETKLKETETLLSVSRALSSTLDLQSLLRHFLRRVAHAVDADTVGSYMLDKTGEWLAPLQGYRLPSEHLDALRSLRLSIRDYPFYAEGARTKRPIFSRRVAADPRIPPIVHDQLPHQSQLFVPIVTRDHVIGGLVAVWWHRGRDFSDSDLALIEAIATQAGAALENARLFQENSRQIKELSVLHALSRAVTGELDRGTVIEALSTEVARVFDARNLFVALRRDGDDDLDVVLWMRHGVRHPAVPVRMSARQAGLTDVVMRTGLPLRTDDQAGEWARHGIEPLTDSAPARYWLGAPMTDGNRAFGVIALASAEREERDTAFKQLAAAQDQLLRTEKLRALGEMASGVAHDFNNVLAAILGRAQLLIGHLRDARLREWAQIIDRAAQDGAQTVRRLQEFTRIRRDHPVVAVDLSDVVRGALDMTQSRWRDEPASRNIAIELRTSLRPVPRIAGDPAELREAMTNLILNALDAMPEGGVLTLGTQVTGAGIEVTVADTGVGMSEGVKEKIFDPFFTTKGPRGTGLGLSMTYGILVRHDAHIAVESAPGQGSVFRLTFSALLPDTETVTAPATPAPAPAAPLRCLVIDDEDAVGRILGDILASAGHTPVVLRDPAAAIALAASERFDVVFTDLAMPGLTGWEVARSIKAASPDSVVLLMTGYGVELSHDEQQRHGVDAVLTKPAGIAAILEAVARAAPRRDPPRQE